MAIPEYKDVLGVHVPAPDYVLAAWEKLHHTMVVPENFSFYLFERIGTDAIQLQGDSYVPSKNKLGWKPTGQNRATVVITRREVLEYTARKTAPPVDDEEALRRIQAKVELLLDEARELNVVVTIENRPMYPLAMGRYEMVADVRKGRA